MKGTGPTNESVSVTHYAYDQLACSILSSVHYMSFGALGIAVAILWLIIYGLHNIFTSPSNNRFYLPLPVPASISSRTRAGNSSIHVTLHNLQLRLETKSFNKLHSRCIVRFADANNSSGRCEKKALTLFYDTGSVFAVLGLLGVLCIGLFAAGSSIGSLASSRHIPPADAGPMKRSLEVMESSIRIEAAEQFLKPIVSL